MSTDILLTRARSLRARGTDAERHLWYFLRAKRLGVKFRRQVPVGPYIVDFLCYEKRLAVELDGGQHQENAGYDARRTAILGEKGIQVLRFWNHEVLQQTVSVLEAILQALSPTLSREEVLEQYSMYRRGRGG